MRCVKHALNVFLIFAIAACAAGPRRTGVPELAVGGVQPDTMVRVLLAFPANAFRVSSSSQLMIVEGSTGTLIGTTREGAVWNVRPLDRDAIELTRAGSAPVVVRNSAVVLRAESTAGFLMYEGKRYRGAISLWRDSARVSVINRLPVEEYLLGVVPLEIGTRREDEREAVAAQAISARSFTYARQQNRRRDSTRRYDLAADVTDQAYGGVDAEIAFASQQVRATRNQVLMFRDRIVETVYSASCGGATADAANVWPFGGQPFLRSVSDAIPNAQGNYCDIAPRATWTASPTQASLAAGIDAYLRNYTAVSGRITSVDSIKPVATNASGRVTTVALVTNAGRYEVSGDRIRFVLRPLNGELLRSTHFSVSSSLSGGEPHFDFNGRGNGHGVGMCQWGAIGRARAGQSAERILETYFPGTSVGKVGG